MGVGGSCHWETGDPLEWPVIHLLGLTHEKKSSAFLHCNVDPLRFSELLQSLERSHCPILESLFPSHFSPHLKKTLLCAWLQASLSSPGKWESTWSASRRMATTWPTAPCPSWWSSPRLVTPAELKSMAVASQKAGPSRCLTSSWIQGTQVCIWPQKIFRKWGECAFFFFSLTASSFPLLTYYTCFF